MDAAEGQASREPGFVGCWVNTGWSAGLGVPDEFRAMDPVDGTSHGHDGFAAVLVARDDANGSTVSVAGFLVDVHCLGVKSAVLPRRMTSQALPAHRQQFFSGFHDEPLAISLELARHLVFGAVDFARGLGFEPHPDYWGAVGHLGEWEGRSVITFGRNGKPFYIAGPYDDAGRIVQTLQNSVGEGNFHFSMPLSVG